MVSRATARLAAGSPPIAAAHFRAEADPYHPATNPGGYVNLGTAESRLMWDMLAPRLAGPRPRTAADIRYGHLHGTDELRGAVAALLSGTWRTPVAADDLVVVSGATAALDIVASVLCDPGEAIVIPAPYYSGLDVDLAGRSGARLIAVPMTGERGGRLAPAEVDRALSRLRLQGVTVRAIAITSPSNPQGHVHSVATLRELLLVAQAHDVDVISDEIYAHSVFGPERFVSLRDPAVWAGVPDADPGRVHVVWGFAKDFGLPGLKVGVLHTVEPRVLAASRALAYFAPTSTDTQALLVDLLADTDWVQRFLTESRTRLAASRRAAGDLLARLDLDYVPPAAGFSIWLDLSGCLARPTFDAERLLWERLFGIARLNILPGRVFSAPEPGWFRLCHAVDPAMVREGSARLAMVVSGAALRRSA